MRLVNWLVPIAALIAYGVLIFYMAPRLAAGTGGLAPFDLRLLGYGAAEAQAFLGAMTPQAKALYLGPARLNDTIFPILFTLTLCLPLRRLHWALSLPALAYGMLDLAENWAVARLVATGPAVDLGSIALASGLTQAKFAACGLAVILALVGLWRNWRAGRAT